VSAPFSFGATEDDLAEVMDLTEGTAAGASGGGTTATTGGGWDSAAAGHLQGYDGASMDVDPEAF
jgi:hypothetical protein